MASRVPKNPDERPIDDYRPIKVICIGAGMNGIAVGALLPQHIPNLELTIYEKNPEVGGTWYENHYPGLRPDLTPHVYQYTFASNPNWTRFYPPGAEFEEYLKAVAAKFKVYDNTKFSHKFIKAEWFEEDGQWEVHVQRLSDNEIIVDRAEFLIKATGLVNEWQWPHIPGREKFKGTMLHTANWDDNFDPTGLKVAVLGYGSTGVQITPAIQPIVKQLDHYVRGKVWVPPGGGTNTEELIERGVENNFDHDLAERKYFSENPKAYLQFRRKQEAYCNNVQKIFFRDTEASVEFTKFLDSNLKESTRKKPWLYEALKPDYPPGCRRLIMGQIWLEKMQEPNANIISRDVVEFTEKGLIDSEGWRQNMMPSSVPLDSMRACKPQPDHSSGGMVSLCSKPGTQIQLPTWVSNHPTCPICSVCSGQTALHLLGLLCTLSNLVRIISSSASRRCSRSTSSHWSASNRQLTTGTNM